MKIKTFWEETILSFVSKYRFWILGVLWLVCVFHSIYHFSVVQSFDGHIKELFNIENNPLVIKNGKNRTSSYMLGVWVGVLIIGSLKHIPFVIAIAGVYIAFAQFNYKYLFKIVFEKDGFGVLLYCILMLVLYLAFYFSLAEFIGKEADKHYIHGFITNTLFVFGILYAIIYHVIDSQKRLRQLSIQKTKAELGALKAQVNPHFLFNTLNNLYGTAMVEGSTKTAAGIQQLAGIMRHVVEESKHEKTPIEKEIKFLGDYIELQEIRLPKRENIMIHTKIDWDEKSAKITPLLLIPFVENAFKYGISITQKCFIEMVLVIENQKLIFDCSNSIIPNNHLEKSTGTGIESVKKRLKLLYPSHHTLEISDKNQVFSVHLSLDLSE